MTTTKHKLHGTPLGQLFDMGLTNQKISEITSVQGSAVSKWRYGLNTAGVARQMRAKGYLDGLNASPKAEKITPDIAVKAPMQPIPQIAPKADALYLIAVSAAQLPRFQKLMTLGGFEFVDVDQ